MNNNNDEINLDIDTLENVSGGSDVEALRFKGKDVPLPEPKSKKPEDGGYIGKVIVNQENK